jgi:Putative prokaryotic signal transducing protein
VKTVFVADSPAQAHLVMGLLEEQGIRCVVEGEMLFGARGDLGLTQSTLPKVCVADEDLQRAAELIAACERDRAKDPAEEDDDAAPPPPLWRGAGRIAVLWVLLGAVAGLAAGAVAVPIVGVCLFVHLFLHFERAT